MAARHRQRRLLQRPPDQRPTRRHRLTGVHAASTAVGTGPADVGRNRAGFIPVPFPVRPRNGRPDVRDAVGSAGSDERGGGEGRVQ